MSIRSYFKRNPIQTIEGGTTTLYVKLTVGSTGAVTTATGYGLTSVTRESAGRYTILLDRKYTKLLGVQTTVIQATVQGLGYAVLANSITSAGSVSGTVSVTAVATDPSSGTIIMFAITVADSSLKGGTV